MKLNELYICRDEISLIELNYALSGMDVVVGVGRSGNRFTVKCSTNTHHWRDGKGEKLIIDYIGMSIEVC